MNEGDSCSVYHCLSSLETAAVITGRACANAQEMFAAKPKQGIGNRKVQGGSPQLTLHGAQDGQGGSMSRLQVIVTAWLSVHTKPQIRYVTSSEMQHFVELRPVPGHF